jgi:hypothetical protein
MNNKRKMKKKKEKFLFNIVLFEVFLKVEPDKDENACGLCVSYFHGHD